METLLKEWDGETVIIRYDQPTGAWIFIAIHSTHLGPAAGGTRMKPFATVQEALQDAMRLAAGMSYKFATPGIPFGGGKAVIAIPPDLDPQARPALLRRYGKLVHQLGGLFSTGPDVGTSSADMDIIAETGAPYVFARTPAAGGAGSPGPFTALGVFTGIQVASEHIFGDESLKGRRVLVQGTGSVGSNLIEHLLAAEAEVSFSEVDDDAIRRYQDELGLKYLPAEEVYSTECDIFAPCALGGVLNAEKWWPKNPRWLGRQPAFFYPGNVTVDDGKLLLAMRKQEVPDMPRDKGYHTYTSAAVQSKTLVKYGYFEVKCRPMNSHGQRSA